MYRAPNETSEVSYTKYTFNFQHNLRLACEAVKKKHGLRHLSEVLEMMIRHYLAFSNPSSLKEILEYYHKESVLEYVRNYPRIPSDQINYPLDPPKRFMGFIGGLRRNPYVYAWFKKINEKNIDNEKSKQYTLKYRNED